MNLDRIYLITRADDCGSTPSANAGVLETCRNGVARNAGFMMPCPHVKEAAELFRGDKNICFGLHTMINSEWDRVRWKPVLPPDEVASLVQRDGTFFPTPAQTLHNKPVLEHVMAELQAQLELARQYGLDVRYADTHMGYGWIFGESFYEAYGNWCKREGLVDAHAFHDMLPEVESASNDPVERLIAQMEAAAPGLYLYVTHPAADGKDMRELGHDGYPGEQVAAERERDRRLYTDERFIAYCEQKGIVLTRYDEAVKLAGNPH